MSKMELSYEVPAFAIIGHPNEGKSTIVSTLAEDDNVRISPIPGETLECMDFPVKVDGREIIRFIDTPGFQNPRKALAWFKDFDGDENKIIQEFVEANYNDRDLDDECRLLTPLSKGAGIIYIVDGTRPVRKIDIIEMEILRLTGQPRIAIINNKDDNPAYIEAWKREFLKNFNAVRVFNGQTATYIERIELLESLKMIFQDWQQALAEVIDAFKADWTKRNKIVSFAIVEMLIKSISYKEKQKISDNSQLAKIKKRQLKSYKAKINSFEQETCGRIKKMFKHNIFHYDLPPASILHSDLFDAESVRVLGLSPNQLALAGGAAGGMVGAAVDIAAHGLTFGLFTVLGGASGAGYAFVNKDKMVRTKVAGLRIGKKKITTGPCKNIQFMYIQLDRILLYYSHVINWAHGRRESRGDSGWQKDAQTGQQGFAVNFSDEARKALDTMFVMVTNRKKDSAESEQKAVEIIEEILDEMFTKK